MTARIDVACGLLLLLLTPIRHQLSVCPQVEVARHKMKNDCSRYAYKQHCTSMALSV